MLAGLLAAALVAGARLALTAAPSGAPRNFVTVTGPGQLAEAMSYRGPALVIFTETTCYFCHVLLPYAVEYARLHPGVEVVNVVLDRLYSADPRLTEELVYYYGVQGTPTEVVVYNGSVYGYHAGIWESAYADQLPFLEQFVNASLSSRPIARALLLQPSGLPRRTPGPAALYYAAGPLASLALGALAAVSPCSLPALALYSASSRRRAVQGIAAELAALTAGVAAFGAAVSLAYSASPAVEGAVEGFAAGLASFLGYEVLRGRVISPGGPARLVAPLAGLECSLPFFVAAMAVASAGGLARAVLGAVAFGAGYAAVYVGAAGAAGAALERLQRRYWRLSGAVLLAAGLALLAYAIAV